MEDNTLLERTITNNVDPYPNPKHFGKMVKKLRKQLTLTQKEIADQLGVGFTYISKIENGKLDVLPSEKLLRNMARIFHVDEEEFLTFAGKLDLDALQQVAQENGVAANLLRQIANRKLSKEQWLRMSVIVTLE